MDQNLKDRIAKANALRVAFVEVYSKTGTYNGRHKMTLESFVRHSKEVTSLFGSPEELRKAPALEISKLQFDEPFLLPPGEYPSVRIINCEFTGGFQMENTSVYGSLELLNYNDGSSRPTEITLTKVCVDNAISIIDFIVGSLNIYACSSRDITLANRIERLSIDRHSVFMGNASLSNCTNVGISDTVFNGAFVFNASSGQDELEITNSTYEDLVTFNAGAIKFIHVLDSELRKGIRFRSRVNEEAVFKNVRFFKKADFQKSEFGGTTTFEGSEFHCAPEFYGATLFPDTGFHKTKFLEFSGESEYAAYRELRHLSHNTLKSAQDESRFFAYEQKSLANVHVKYKGKRVEGYLSKLYGLASNHGQSFIRPFTGLIVLNLIFWISYASIPNAIVVSEEATRANAWHTQTPEHFGLVLQNLFQPFAIFGKTASYIPNCLLVTLLSILQTVTSLVLFALFILAIRRRFRKGSE